MRDEGGGGTPGTSQNRKRVPYPSSPAKPAPGHPEAPSGVIISNRLLPTTHAAARRLSATARSSAALITAYSAWSRTYTASATASAASASAASARLSALFTSRSALRSWIFACRNRKTLVDPKLNIGPSRADVRLGLGSRGLQLLSRGFDVRLELIMAALQFRLILLAGCGSGIFDFLGALG